ncbi:MAG: hypothetical protein NT154_19625, partial [Verrucomicrobia bacterium]|nr:hypothetical protein [Verrucomicrobiota bacterium]
MNIIMTNRIVTRRCVALLMVTGVAASAAIENLAAKAKITANGIHSLDYDPKYLADGLIPEKDCHDDLRQAWCLPRAVATGAALTFEWPSPVSVAEVVYWGRTAWEDGENFSAVEVFTNDDLAKPVAIGKLKRGPQPQRITLEQPIRTARLALRFPSNYGGSNPGASEIGIYDKKPTDGDLGIITDSVSPEILADIRAGKMGFTRLLMVQHRLQAPSHVYTYHQEDLQPGGGLWVCDLAGAEPKLTRILDAGGGMILDANLHYDGKTILFSWKRTMQDFFQLYTVDIDGNNLKPLTEHDSNNFNASWLPDGGIVFLSDRKPAFAYCWKTTTPILYRCAADGSHPTRISANYLNDFTPAVIQDGRIIYSRWEYVDRPAIPIQSMWAINPDGTHLTGVFGNRILSPATFMDAREIPG